MTLIASYITKYGIIQASDSNLTNDSGNAGFGQKIFPITHLNSSLAYSGSYTINNKALDIWLNEFISGSFFTTNSIEEFCKMLLSELNREMQIHEIEKATIIQIAGYSTHNNKSYLEHWHIANVVLDLTDGNYSKSAKSFSLYNDFNSLTIRHHKEFLNQMDNDPMEHTWYINGFPPGRISSVIVKQSIDESLKIIWSNPNWKFHKPKNIFEFSNIVKLYFDFVTRLFPMSDYNALYIGGEIQTHLIPVPQNIDKDI